MTRRRRATEAAATEAEAALAEAAREAPWSALLAATAEEEEDGSEGSEPPTCVVGRSVLKNCLIVHMSCRHIRNCFESQKVIEPCLVIYDFGVL